MRTGAQRFAARKILLDGPLDVLVVGGGIGGAGIARDAAMRGLRVALLEQHDFAFGTSSRSSRLLHGGLRYLAQGRLGLVREASVEKKIIHRIAPHLARPLPFIFPAYRFDRDWVLWQLKMGVKIYDLLCGGRNFGRSTWMRPAQVLAAVEGLAPADLAGAVRYYDGFTNDARLTIDTLRSAERAGAALLNYARFLGASRDTLWECHVDDLQGQCKLKVRARTIVNAAGAWASLLPQSRVRLRLTKGVHLVVDHLRLPVNETVVMTQGKRILFAIPWGERTILGTTDTDYDGLLDEVHVDSSDLRYVLRVVNRYFPQAHLAPRDVLSAWAGLRPLLADPTGRPSDVSRSHEIRSPEPGWWDVAGGKLTTYRLMAEQTVDRVLRYLAQAGAGLGNILPCETAFVPLLPAQDTEFSGLLPPAFSRHAVEHYCLSEWALHLDDVMIRRTGWHYYHRDALERGTWVADCMAELFGWSDSQRTEELDRYHAAADCLHWSDSSSLTSTPSRNDQPTVRVV